MEKLENQLHNGTCEELEKKKKYVKTKASTYSKAKLHWV